MESSEESSMELTTTNVGGVDVIELPTSPTIPDQPHFQSYQIIDGLSLEFFQALLEAAAIQKKVKEIVNANTIANLNVMTPIQVAKAVTTIENGRTIFEQVAKLALAEMASVSQMMSTIPVCLAKYLVNRRFLYMINGYIEMLNGHQGHVEGRVVWTREEARNAVFVMTQIRSGFHNHFILTKCIADTPLHEREALGKKLHEKYMVYYGDKF